jgi:hypothetical protein
VNPPAQVRARLSQRCPRDSRTCASQCGAIAMQSCIARVLNLASGHAKSTDATLPTKAANLLTATLAVVVSVALMSSCFAYCWIDFTAAGGTKKRPR